MNVHLYAWAITVVVMITILAIDVFIIGRRPHEPSIKEAVGFIGLYVGLAVIFGLALWRVSGPRYAGEFFAGWLTEYSLSVDNLFIFLIIMSKLKVPRQLQQFALLVGIILALVFRGIFIAVGAAAIEPGRLDLLRVRFLLQLFTRMNIFINYTRRDDAEGMPDNAALRTVERRFDAVDDFRPHRGHRHREQPAD